MRVVRFYVNLLRLLLLLLLLILSRRAVSPLPDLNRDHLRSVFLAGPQPRPSEPSVPSRTSAETIWAQCSLPDLNRDHLRPVFPAGPQPTESMSERRSEDMSERMLDRMSEHMSERMSESMSDRMSERMQKECPKICQKEGQKICQKECQNRNCQRWTGSLRTWFLALSLGTLGRELGHAKCHWRICT